MHEILLSDLSKPREDGFVGEVLAADFISPAALSSAVGITVGTLINPNESWLCVNNKGKELYIAKKPIRYNLSFVDLYNLGLTTGSKRIQVGNRVYKVRLLNDDNGYGSGNTNLVFDVAATFGSEWNALMYRLSSEQTGSRSGEGILYGEWAKYSAADLGMNSGNGSHSICGSISNTSNERTAFRGYNSVRGYSNGNLSGSVNARGWRPVLELTS